MSAVGGDGAVKGSPAFISVTHGPADELAERVGQTVARWVRANGIDPAARVSVLLAISGDAENIVIMQRSADEVENADKGHATREPMACRTVREPGGWRWPHCRLLSGFCRLG